MKTLYALPFVFLFALGCTEEILVPGPTIHDTLYFPDPCGCIKHDTLILERVDTVFITTHDTVVQVRIDSVFITRTIIETKTDTVFQTLTDTLYIHIYHDTLVTFESGRVLEVFGIYKDIAIEFSRLSYEAGWDEAIGGNCIIEPWRADEAPPETRSAFSYFIYDQYMVKLKESLTHDESYTPLFREFAHKVLKKPYTTGDNIMNPDFPAKKILFTSSDAVKKPYLDVLFAK